MREWIGIGVFVWIGFLGCIVDGYVDYSLDDKIPVYVNKVGPFANPHETYHYYALPLCRPDKIVHHSLSLGQVLDGDRMADSSFDIHYQKVLPQTSLCGSRKLSVEDVNRLVEAIEGEYYAQLIMDDLKVHHFIGKVEEANVFPHEHRIFLYTHYMFDIHFNGFNVIAVNLKMNKSSTVELNHDEEAEIDIRYSVIWTNTRTPIAARSHADSYSSSSHSMFFSSYRSSTIHWLSILNSLLLVSILVVIVSIIIFSSVRRDLSRYNNVSSIDDDYDLLIDNGWKTVAGDVFRPPNHPMVLSAILGAGSQLIALACALLIIGTTNIVEVHNHGLLNSLCVVIYAFTCCVAGYVSSYNYQSFEGKRWVLNINMTSIIFVAPLALAWAFTNTVAWIYGSTQALPWTTVVAVVAIWLLIGYPLTVVGGVIGRAHRLGRAGSTAPFRTRTVPRELPRQTPTRSTPVQALMGGLLPFCAISVELSYIFSTIWGRDTYTLFPVLAIIFVILLVVVACCSIALTYFQLNGEDYHWWWRSVLVGGSVSVYMFLYGILFLRRSTSMSGVLQLSEFITHLSLLCFAAFLACGTIAHVAASRFVQYIYSSVKSD